MDDPGLAPHPFAPVMAAFEAARGMDAPLNERMRVIQQAVRAASAPFADAVDTFVGRLQAAHAGADAPKVGEPMPSFLLPDENGHLVSLGSLLGVWTFSLFFTFHDAPAPPLVGLAIAGAVLVTLRHRQNIGRLLRGEEKRA